MEFSVDKKEITKRIICMSIVGENYIMKFTHLSPALYNNEHIMQYTVYCTSIVAPYTFN